MNVLDADGKSASLCHWYTGEYPVNPFCFQNNQAFCFVSWQPFNVANIQFFIQSYFLFPTFQLYYFLLSNNNQLHPSFYSYLNSSQSRLWTQSNNCMWEKLPPFHLIIVNLSIHSWLYQFVFAAQLLKTLIVVSIWILLFLLYWIMWIFDLL